MTTTSLLDQLPSEALQPDGLARRELGTVTRASDDGRTITGIGVPFGETIQLAPGLWERFEPGACDDTDALAFWRHNDPIGVVTDATDTEQGREVTLRISTTPQGDEACTLARDGVIRSLSIGFRPIEWRIETDEDTKDETIVYTSVRALEYSLVPFPAYSSASISSVRSEHHHPTSHDKETTTMSITREDLDGLAQDMTNRLDDMNRRMAELGNAERATSPLEAATQFRSIGDWVKAITDETDQRHDSAVQLHRDVTTSDIPAKLVDKPGFIGDLTRKIVERRRFINKFTTRALPPKGMTVDFLQTEFTAKVAEQTNELDELSKTQTFKINEKSAKVRTFGGASTVSRQVIDRSDAWALNGMFEAFALAYARETELATKKFVTDKIDEILSAAVDGTFLELGAEGGALAWIDALVDAAGVFEDKGFELSGLSLSPDLFKELAAEAGTDGRPLLTLHGQGVNVVGEMNLPAASGQLMRLPVDVLHGTSGKAVFFDPVAIETLESPGAPFWLQEDRALNLARDLACYGYLAHIFPHPGALLPVKIGE